MALDIVLLTGMSGSGKSVALHALEDAGDVEAAAQAHEHAHRLLHTDMPITEVALQCGYTDHSAFTRQFKALTGFTPRQYRQATGH